MMMLLPRIARHAATAATALNLACLSHGAAGAPALPPAPASDTALAAPGGARAPTRAPDTRVALRQSIDSLLDQPEFRNATWGVLVVDPTTGDTLYSENAGKLFLPASNLKLVTTSVALTALGADYRWITTLAARGKLRRGVLDGDLLVYGRGDPSASDSVRGDAMRPLHEIADSLYLAGVRRVRGRLVVGADVFPGPTVGFGWSWDDLDDRDGAAVDELVFNDGFGQLHVHAAGRVGAPPRVTTTPAATYPTVRVVARTVARSDTAALHAEPLRAVLDTNAALFELRGTMAVGDSTTISVAFSDPDDAYLSALREALADRGIVVQGQRTDTTAAVDSLSRIQSPTLGDILPALLKASQNQMAELLLHTIGLSRTGVGRADSAARVESDQLLAWGASPDGFVLRDGSGLARYDYLTPETVARVLDAMRRSPAFETFYTALPVAGVDGTLHARMRGTAAEGNVHAKTGSLSNTRSLSGYVTTANGRMLIFSVLCNNFTAGAAQVLGVQDAIAARLASLNLR
jgi:serine-type D-Ala-D-Ala carboxypeptidase/endopeptidase (penicillin-binding protein 4)